MSVAVDAMAQEVREGLTRDLKELSPKYFYDARGSELFDQITTLPEYYPCRAEREILNRRAPEIVDGASELVELGSGMASKTRALLYAMAGAGSLERYVPFDVDQTVIDQCAEELAELYPGLRGGRRGGRLPARPGPRSPTARIGCSRSSAARSATSIRPSGRASWRRCGS